MFCDSPSMRAQIDVNMNMKMDPLAMMMKTNSIYTLGELIRPKHRLSAPYGKNRAMTKNLLLKANKFEKNRRWRKWTHSKDRSFRKRLR